MQVPSLRRLGWRFRPEWAPRDPGLLRMARLMAPATVGLAAVQVNIFVNSRFASHEPGAVSWLDYAFRLLYLPIGLFGVALGTIATAGLARRAAEGDMEGLRNTLRQSLSMLAYLTVPATVGLMVLGVPVVRLLYERGRFTPADTQATAAALFLYSLGLVGYTGVKVLAPAFYALGAPRVPLLASVLAVATNLAVILALNRGLGFRAIALGTALGSLVNAGLLVAVFERRVGGLFGHGLFRPVARMGVAAGGMAVCRLAGGGGPRAAARDERPPRAARDRPRPGRRRHRRLRPADPRAAGGGGRGPLAHGPRAAGASEVTSAQAVKAWLDHLRVERGLADATLTAYERDLRELVAFAEARGVPLLDLGQADLALFFGSLRERGLGPRSQARHVFSARAFYRFALREGLVRRDPTENLRPPKAFSALPRYLTPGQVDALLAAPDVTDPGGPA